MATIITDNVILAREDHEKLKRKGVISPDLSDMPYVIHDTTYKAMFYFRKRGSYEKFYRRLIEEGFQPNELTLSHEICQDLST